MILREKQNINGYSDEDLNKKLRNEWLHQERLKKIEKQYLQQLKLDQEHYDQQNYEYEQQNQHIQNQQKFDQLYKNPTLQVSSQRDLKQNEKLTYNSIQELKNDPIILNKFHQIMQDNLKDDQSILKTCEERKQTKVNFDVKSDTQSVLSDNISKLSITESKLGEMLLKNGLSQQDLQRLIKDNFSYFKHYLGYCICFQCDCGMCRCQYVKKDQKKIKFRGAYISLYNHDYNKQQNDKNIEETNKLKQINMNLQKNLFFGDYMNNVFDNTDKITSAPLKKQLQWKLQSYQQPEYYKPLFDLTTNKQSYQKIGKLQKQEKYEHFEQMPNWIDYKLPIGTTYKQDFLRNNYTRQASCKIADQNLFPSIPSLPSNYRSTFTSPNYTHSKNFENINQQQTLGLLESQNQPTSTTNRKTYQNPGPLGCKQSNTDHQLKKLIFQKVDQMIKENKQKQESETQSIKDQQL